MNERVARERVLAARATRYPEIEVGLKGGILGQPIVWKHGLSDPTWPETPDWQQNYSLDVTQLVYLTDKGEAFHQWLAPQLELYYQRLQRELGLEQLKLTEKLLKDLQHVLETY